MLRKSISKHYTISTVDLQEIDSFQKFSSEWWDKYGFMKGLHAMNKLRIPLIRQGLLNAGNICESTSKSPTPLQGLDVLDVGCGGGILSEPLAKLGGRVTGIDAANEAIDIAKKHAEHNSLRINYLCTSIDNYCSTNEEKHDVVVASEILEHVTEKEKFIKACLRCLKPYGSIFITTINKTFLSQFVAIYLAENILQLVPKGTHHYSKFYEPHKLQNLLSNNGIRTLLVHGMCWNIWTNTWHWCSDTSVNYVLHGVKTL
ncbi:ubiquinone biosynthesis O-methyltransferase, mitochondrial [Cylas formicarius]|uniref:ubiquinone biosynthesis O-methyltransferase, mitochondrial n=1 Tax=Cylas formicarius TaxID=197179 RepID=UPI002958AF15|nr:ubiquinone biosynthesis O-methyltransferase, mitochondrial [Cylas formicarius]